MTDQKNAKKNDDRKTKSAVVNGRSVSCSIKHATAVCNMIRNKNIDKALSMVQEVIEFKKPVPMKGEIPHKKGIMSGRYPVKCAKIVLGLLKSLKANAINNELELEEYKIMSVPNLAYRPYKRFGQGRMKRCHITLKLINIKKDKHKNEANK